MNVVQFWPVRVLIDPGAVLRPGGLIATTYMRRVGEDKVGQANGRARMLENTMHETGFEQHETHWITLGPAPAFCIVART